MKWIVASLGAALLLAGAALYLSVAKEPGAMPPSGDGDYYKQAYERLSAKYAYLKRKNGMLAEKLNRHRSAFRHYRDLVMSKASAAARRRERLLEQGRMPIVGAPATALALEDCRDLICSRHKAMQRLGQEILGYEEGDTDPLSRLCADASDREEAYLLDGAVRAALRYREAENNATLMAALWRQNANDLLALLEPLPPEKKREILAYYATMPEKLGLSPKVRESMEETLAYWQTVYGL